MRDAESPFGRLVEAKARRDVARDTLLEALLSGADAGETAALKRAVQLATEDFKAASADYQQISDSSWFPGANT